MASATADERYFVSLINQARQDRNLSTLQIEKSLNELADSHSAWMLDTDTFSHTGQGDSSATDRMRDAGFIFRAAGYRPRISPMSASIMTDPTAMRSTPCTRC